MKNRIFVLCIFCILSKTEAQTAKISLNAKKINNELYLDYDKENIRYGLKKTANINQLIDKTKTFASKQNSLSINIISKNPILNEIVINTNTIENLNYKSYKETLTQLLTQIRPIIDDGKKETGFQLFNQIPKDITNDEEFKEKISSVISLINKTTQTNSKENTTELTKELKLLNLYINKETTSLKNTSTYNWEKVKTYERQIEIVTTLNAYSKLLSSWSEKIEKSLFEIKNIDKISRDSIKVVAIKIIKKTLSYDKDENLIKLETNEKETLTATLNFEKFSRFVPEVRAAIVFTDLSFPKFGTETNDNDQQVVSESKDEKFNKINAGLMVNFNYNLGGDELVPFFQLGVGPSKKYPILFSGAGVRINDTFMISAGGAWTWINELSSLQIGDIVSGTTAIEADQAFKFSTSPKLYLSLQIKI